MFDSPFDRCPVCGKYVLLDQTRKECAKEHDCAVARCPLEDCFTGVEVTAPAKPAPPVGKKRHK